MKKLPKLSAVKRKANLTFSNFIRERDGWRCVLCGSTSVVQCGHLIKRGKKIHLFSEVNCHALCSRCNWKDNYDHDVYVMWFIKKYGVRAYDKLVATKENLCQMKRADYLNIIEKYKMIIKHD
jgi:transcription elongation factor Elf1